jgi:hypothetical protein
MQLLKLENHQVGQLVTNACPGDCLHKDGTIITYKENPGVFICIGCSAEIGNQILASNHDPLKHKPNCPALKQRIAMYNAIYRLQEHAVDIAAAYLHAVYELEKLKTLP